MTKDCICEYCNKKIILQYPSWTRRYHPECYKKIRKGKRTNTGRTCFKKGQRPWNWKGGNSKFRKYLLAEWKELIKIIYERDNYTCQICGKKGGRLNAHHIKHWSEYPKLAFKESNIITLCIPCHASEHYMETIGPINEKRKQRSGGEPKNG